MTSGTGNQAAEVNRLLRQPICGGVFGRGRYELARLPCVLRGLHSIRYMVVAPEAGAVLSVSEDKTETLAGARRVLSAANDLAEATNDESTPEQLEIWPMDGPAAPVAPRQVSRRRREIF